MRARPVLFALLMTAALAGCAGKAIDCPDEYGPDFEEAYKQAVAELEEQGVELTDSDGDCWADIAENQIGTDPDNYDSHPSLDQGKGFVENNTPPPPMPAPEFVWVEQPYEGNFQSIPGGPAFAATGAYPVFDVPEGAEEVYFNITISAAADDEFFVGFFDPEHQSGTDESQVDFMTSGGEGSGHADSPLGGEWRFALSSQTLPNQGSYTLTVNSLVPMADAMDMVPPA